jgi:hypothetical protein
MIFITDTQLKSFGFSREFIEDRPGFHLHIQRRRKV